MKTSEAKKLQFFPDQRAGFEAKMQAIIDAHNSDECGIRPLAVRALQALSAKDYTGAATWAHEIRCVTAIDNHAACYIQRPQRVPKALL